MYWFWQRKMTQMMRCSICWVEIVNNYSNWYIYIGSTSLKSNTIKIHTVVVELHTWMPACESGCKSGRNLLVNLLGLCLQTCYQYACRPVLNMLLAKDGVDPDSKDIQYGLLWDMLSFPLNTTCQSLIATFISTTTFIHEKSNQRQRLKKDWKLLCGHPKLTKRNLQGKLWKSRTCYGKGVLKFQALRPLYSRL